MVYLDNAASTPLLPEVADFYFDCLKQLYGNSQADHGYALQCRRAIIQAAREVLAAAGNPNGEIVWTSGGTESINTVLNGIGLQAGDEVITSQMEHAATDKPLAQLEKNGVIVKRIPIDSEGQMNVEKLSTLLTSKTKLVSLVSLHNELGTITDIDQVGKILKEKQSEALFHLDHVQGFGKMRLNWQTSRLDLISIAGHKFHAPNSIGAIVYRKGINLKPLILGGSQQRGLRAGSQDSATIAAMGFAAVYNDKFKDEKLKLINELNDFCRKGLNELKNKSGEPLKVVIHSAQNNSPYILFFSIVGYEGAVIMRFLGKLEVYVGVGSACSSESKSPNKVLSAMKVSDADAFAALRVSFGWQNTIADVTYFLEKLQYVVKEY